VLLLWLMLLGVAKATWVPATTEAAATATATAAAATRAVVESVAETSVTPRIRDLQLLLVQLLAFGS
jgi:hypothetical protein